MSAAAPERWVVATGNAGKLAELGELLGPLGLELSSLRDVGVESPEETGLTFVENALLKARHAAAATGLPAIADDSGLVVPALGGAPGVRSARFAGDGATDAANIDHLLHRLEAIPCADRSAAFVCVIVALRAADDPVPALGFGRWAGTIGHGRTGSGGFGYDPVFVDSASGQTAAQLSRAAKNARSHRGQAVRALAAVLSGPRSGR